MDSIIEVQRQTHEEIEHFERALYQILAKPTPLHQQRVQAEHRATQILDRVSARVNALNNLYQSDDTRKQEIAAISGSSRADELSGSPAGRSFLFNAFSIDPQELNFISFALSRSKDDQDEVRAIHPTASGILSIHVLSSFAS